MNKKFLILSIILSVLGLIAYSYFKPKAIINNFDECVMAGYPIMETDPEQCHVPNGATFVKAEKNDSEDIAIIISSRDVAIEQYLETQSDFVWQTADNSSNVCVFEQLGSENDLFPLYLWVQCQEYKPTKDGYEQLSGVSVPVLLDYPNELSYYKLENFTHQVPGDGSLYKEDIEKLFPTEIREKIFGYQGQDRLNKAIKEKIMMKDPSKRSTFPDQNSEATIDCESLEEQECLKNQYSCSLCGEKVTSNYISCHSIEFCEQAVKSMY